MPVYLVGYGIWRFFIEFARSDDRGATVVSFLSPSQLIALLLIAAGAAWFALWYFRFRKKAEKAPESPEIGADAGTEDGAAAETKEGAEEGGDKRAKEDKN